MVALLKPKTPVARVLKFDAHHNRHMPSEVNGNWIEIPTGAELDKLVSEKGYEETGSRAVSRFLNESNLRARDVVAAYERVPDAGRVLLSRLLSDDGLRPLFGPLVVSAIAEGFNAVSEEWRSLVRNIPLDAGSIEDFRFEDFTSLDAYTLKLLGQGGEIPVAKITVSGQTIYITMKGRGIEWSDKARRAPLDLATQWLMRVGKRLARQYRSHIGVVARDGYFDDLSDAPDVIETEDATKFQPQDVLNGIAELEEGLGFTATDILISRATWIALKVMQWPSGGGPVSANMNIDATYGPTFHRIESVGDDSMVVLDSSAALVRYEGKPFGTEDKRDPAKGITATYATLEDEIVVGEIDARVVVQKGWT